VKFLSIYDIILKFECSAYAGYWYGGIILNGRCVILTAHIKSDTFDRVQFTSDDYIICADGGYDLALANGIVPALAIGDMDSVTARDFGSTEKIVLPAEKDDTDTLAAVRYGISKGYADFLIIGGLSGRFDHSFAVIQTLSFLTDMGCKAEVIDGGNHAFMIAGSKSGIGQLTLDPEAYRLRRSEAEASLFPFPYFSVYSYSERSEGVSITGAKYPLDFTILTHSYPLGTSNEFIPGEEAVITVVAGRLLIVVSDR
jgi:thiamine pyrophosphokinase